MTTTDNSDRLAVAGEPLFARLVDVELSRPLEPVSAVDVDGRSCPSVWLLVRLCGEPLGLQVEQVPADGLSVAELGSRLAERWRTGISGRLPAAGSPGADALAVAREAGTTAFAAAHQTFLARAEPCSVVICTRNNPKSLRVCLESLVAQDHPRFTVWIIDNDPATGVTAPVVASFAPRMKVRYVPEPRPGLSRARNTALRQNLGGAFVAWLDDDEEADPLWLAELGRAFADRPDASAVNGAVVPAELATQAQVWFEEFGGHTKGRGFVDAEFGPGTRRTQDPLFPLPPFGVGANMAFRTGVLRKLGGFDVALGAGTPTMGGEDTKIFTDLLRSGGTILYRPAALTRHYHRRDLESLTRQMFGYGAGLTAFYTAAVLKQPWVVFILARLAVPALRQVLSPSSTRHATLGADFPAELLAANKRGLLVGPSRYLAQRRKNQRDRHVPGTRGR